MRSPMERISRINAGRISRRLTQIYADKKTKKQARSQESEVSSQKSGIRSLKSEGQESEVSSQKSGIRRLKSEGQESEKDGYEVRTNRRGSPQASSVLLCGFSLRLCAFA